jgi:dihydrofolate synthase/folylpolyglutamate synthase
MPSEFEVVTAIALWYYAKISYPYFVVWETGLGGRLDATNVVVPLASVITHIGHDHQHLLGETITDIAREKAGIIKSGVPVVSGVDDPAALEVISRAARDRKAKFYQIGRDFVIGDVSLSAEGSRFSFQSYFRSFQDIRLRMIGEHQVRNAAVAIMTLEVLRQYYAALIDEEKLRPALAQTIWEGRMEQISTHPQLLLDGAHNLEGAVILAKALEQLYPGREIVLMAGFLRDKDIAGMLQALLPRSRRIVVTEPNHGRAARAEEVATLAKSIAPQLQIDLIKDWKQALTFTKELASDKTLALIMGSLYLVGDVRKELLNH